jgi:hypothetical protein
MTQHDAFTQGFQDATRAHYGVESDVLSELDAINQRAKEYEAKKRSAVMPYQPGTVIEYAPPPPKPYDIPSELAPYTSDAEAWKDLGKGLAKGGAVAGGIAFIWGMVKTIIAYFTAIATAGAASIEAGLMANPGTVAAAGFGLLVAGVLAASGLGGSEPKRTAPGAINQNQNIVVNTTVNVGGSQSAKQ